MSDQKRRRPVRIVQFGEGVFLRGFLDWMVERMNERTNFDGAVAVVKPRPGAFHPAYARQGNRYTVAFKGLCEGRPTVARETVGSLARLVDPHEDFPAFLAEADNPDLACVVSNTTESGITGAEDDRATDRPARSFPGKLTQLLRRRYETFSGDPRRGLIVMPFELIEANGATLEAIVLERAKRWYRDPAFNRWILGANLFLDTLVDRIVSGFSEEERSAIKAETGLEDELVVVAEPYHLLAIKGPPELERVLPFREAGLNVVWTDDISTYRLLKVRLLNGSHTFLTMCGLALGHGNVLDCLDAPTLKDALGVMHAREMLPCLPVPRADAEAYLGTVLERFGNPFLDHRLTSIALNSVAKWKARLMPALLEYAARYRRAPALLSFSLAALTHRYTSGVKVEDDPAAVAAFASLLRLVEADPRGVARSVVEGSSLFGDGLAAVPALTELVGSQLADISALGMEAALRKAAALARSIEGDRE